MKLFIFAQFFKFILTSGLLLAVGLCVWLVLAYKPPAAWTEAEKAVINTLFLASLPPLPVDRSNAASTDIRAVEMGHALFFDSRLSVNQQISCATCHRPELRFTDGLDKARALGKSRRNTPSIVGLAYSPWLYWDGRRDSLWAQALSPLEDPQEQGNNRMAIARLVTEDVEYSQQYQAIFGELPDFSDRSRFPENAGPELKSEWYAA